MKDAAKHYLLGYGLAVSLTALPFALVALRVLPAMTTLGVILIAGLVQMAVHLRWFLHLRIGGGDWRIKALIFTVIVILIMSAGTVWVVQDMNQRMMG